MRMKVFKNPRLFKVNNVEVKDFGKIKLATNEMVSFVTKSKKEYDFTAQDWGFYVTPSINGRLKKEGFKIALVKNKSGKIYIMAVEKEKIKIFNKFCTNQKKKILKWFNLYPKKKK